MFARLTVAAALGLLLLLVAAGGLACNGSEEDSYVGYWRIPARTPPGYDLLEVRRADGSYEVRFDTLAWHRAEVVDGRLQLQKYRKVDSYVSLGLDLEVRGGKGSLLMSASPSPQPFALTRLSEEAYRTKLNAMADDELHLTVFGLSELAKEWAAKHGGKPPIAADMRPDSDFGRYVAQRIVTWPLNPLTGEAMRAGTRPGDFSYTTDGHDFTVTVYYSDGSPVTL